MSACRILPAALPRESRIADWFDGADLADAFLVHLNAADATKGIDHLAKCVVADPPPWVRALMVKRDMFVGGLGIKTSAQLRARAAAEQTAHLDFFHVLSRSEREVIVGEDDWHLNFRASLMIRPRRDGGAEFIATTAVRCQSSFGRAYLAVIAPFHWFIVRANLRRAAKNKWRIDDLSNARGY